MYNRRSKYKITEHNINNYESYSAKRGFSASITGINSLPDDKFLTLPN